MLDYSEAITKSSAFTCIKNDILMSRVSHAYLFVSPDANYILQFAEYVSALLICMGIDDKNTEVLNKRVQKHIHPDVMFVGFDEKINVETAKKVASDACVRPFEAGSKVFVLNTEDMNESSQNKLLKTIEEPPPETYFLLVAKGTQKLLPTVLSRVKKLELGEISSEEILKMLEVSGLSKSDAETFANCSNGNAEFAEKLSKEGSFLSLFQEILECLKKLNGSRDVLKFSSKFSSKDIDKQELFDIFMLILRDVMMVLSKSFELVRLKNVLGQIQEISKGFSVSSVTELIEFCGEAKKELYFNVNGTEVIDKFLFKIAEVKVKCKKL